MKTLKESITKKLPMNTEAGWLLEYQPGNGSRYEVLFQKINSMVSEPFGHGHGATSIGQGATVIVFLNLRNRPSFILQGHTGFLSLCYFMEKTGIEEGDSRALIALIAARCGVRSNVQCFEEEESRVEH